MAVLALWRYPVKAMLGELLERVRIGPGGIEGDRRWVVTDDATGVAIASKRGPTDPRLRACRARIGSEGELAVTLPDGAEAIGVVEAAGALSALLGRRVRIDEHDGHGERYGATGGHHDFAPLHVLTAGALAGLRRERPASDWDSRRFRANVLLGGPHDDRSLLGRALRAPSGARLEVGVPTPRCVVPTRATEQLPRDPSLLRHLVRTNRWDLGPFGRQGCLGVYAEIPRGGSLATGDQLVVGARSAASPEDAAAATVRRVVAAL